ncbi:DNA topoisomerase IB [Sphingomonas sp. SUN039]|uniref:DNA topoisomerase IB n=1 Tax=Sphingomonas sp. SUN039 TaxID=2937787 RepID=UPI0021649655|nr:DNA topoisomerase IB [Sphingomonas sp. SUN039]UVO52736.1 DNA topoisomerase IB [Sphingomonas sp. SUN039]
MIVYVDPEMPGITRRKLKHGWAYTDAKGSRIADRDEIDRLNRIALPPAYVDAWFCPSPHGHIQAIGYDAKGRRQYRYHPDFRATREAEKYDRCSDFGRALPLLRARVEHDLSGRPTARETVLAAIVRLLDIGRVRVGNEAYARSNRSFGATTLRSRHASVKGSKLSLQYRAKSGVLRKLTLTDRGLLRVVRRVQDLPGQNLFQYLDDDGAPCPVGSADVNAYIKEATGDDFTAKHFRTWSASVIALEQVIASCKSGIRPKLVDVLLPVAEALGNTPAIARKSYVHPRVLGLCEAGPSPEKLPRSTRWLAPAERALIALLDDTPADLSKAA